MYDRDMPVMRAHALASPQGLTDTITFVLCTIQMPFQRVKSLMADVKANGEQAAALFGSKRDGYRYAVAHAEVLHAAVVRAVEIGDTIGAVDVLSNIPGLGIVKASFVAQICGLEVACLDGHNLKRLGLSESAFKLAKSVKPDTKRKKIAAYVKACADTGGAKFWWNSWCDYVAGNRANKSLTSGDAVSAYHVTCLV
jgi:hypothetical protein